jgi:hypothetical protein
MLAHCHAARLADPAQAGVHDIKRACPLNETKGDAMAKKEELDEETLALIHWCIEVEGFLVAGGATVEQAQEHIEEQIEWFTDQFYDGLTPEEAAREALA